MSGKKSVLVVCRTAAGQMYLGVLLNRMWYNPMLAKNVEEGVRMAQETAFTLIILDGDIPANELSSTLSLLTVTPAVKGVPVAVFITRESAVKTDELLAQGCSAVLTKPLDLSIVYGVLARLSDQPRHTPRVPTKFRVEIEEGVPEKTLTCVNISEGGLYLRTHQPLPEKTVLHLAFTLPLGTEQIKLASEVVRTSRLSTQFQGEPGMGLRFMDPPEETVLQLRNYVQWELIGDLDWEATI